MPTPHQHPFPLLLFTVEFSYSICTSNLRQISQRGAVCTSCGSVPPRLCWSSRIRVYSCRAAPPQHTLATLELGKHCAYIRQCHIYTYTYFWISVIMKVMASVWEGVILLTFWLAVFFRLTHTALPYMYLYSLFEWGSWEIDTLLAWRWSRGFIELRASLNEMALAVRDLDVCIRCGRLGFIVEYVQIQVWIADVVGTIRWSGEDCGGVCKELSSCGYHPCEEGQEQISWI